LLRAGREMIDLDSILGGSIFRHGIPGECVTLDPSGRKIKAFTLLAKPLFLDVALSKRF